MLAILSIGAELFIHQQTMPMSIYALDALLTSLSALHCWKMSLNTIQIKDWTKPLKYFSYMLSGGLYKLVKVLLSMCLSEYFPGEIDNKSSAPPDQQTHSGPRDVLLDKMQICWQWHLDQ